MKVYGTPLCIHCRNYKDIQNKRGFEAEFIDITESTANLKEFLVIRDTDSIFADIRGELRIGIPLFVNADGAKTHDANVAFGWIGQEPLHDNEEI